MSGSASTSRQGNHKKNDDGDLREQVRVLTDDVKELGRLTKEALVGKVESAKTSARSAVEAGRDRAVDYRDQLADITREKPLKSVLVAAGVGALLGLFLGRR